MLTKKVLFNIGLAAVVGTLLLGVAQAAPLGAAVAAGIGIYQATLQEQKRKVSIRALQILKASAQSRLQTKLPKDC